MSDGSSPAGHSLSVSSVAPMAFWASSSLSISARFLTSAMNYSPFTRRSLLQRVLDSVLQHEGDLQVHLIALYVAGLDHDVLILDPSTFHVP
jgi:hypothetical protein